MPLGELLARRAASARPLRQAYRRAERDGLTLRGRARRSGVPRSSTSSARSPTPGSPTKSTREKGFSLGFFDERYLREGPLALVRARRPLVAFANCGRRERARSSRSTSCATGRTRPAAPWTSCSSSLMLWGRERGLRGFNLGMAPLSGLEDRALAPLWTRLGARALPPRRVLLQLPGAAPVQGEVRAGVAPALPRAPGGVPPAARPHERRGARVARPEGSGRR